MSRPPHENPFRVDRVTTLPYVGHDPIKLIARFERMGYRGAILGPEGAGKSTLLRLIAERLSDAGVQVAILRLPGSATGSQRKEAVSTCRTIPPATVLLFDGFEQLGFWQRRTVGRRLRLLVTIHRRCGIPPLSRCRPKEKTIRRLLPILLDEVSAETESAALRAFRIRRGDVRATFFDLYDAWADGRIDGRQREWPVQPGPPLL